MKRPVRFDSTAELELNEAADYYDLESPGLGAVFLEEVEQVPAKSSEFPDATTPVHAGVRRWLLTKFPYLLLYSLRADEIRILAVAHQGRRPFCWHGRE